MEFRDIICKWWKKVLICLALALALAVFLEWLQVKTQPVVYETVISEKSDPKEIELEAGTITDCVYDGRSIVVEGGPAQLFFTDCDIHASCIRIHYEALSETDSVMRVLFARAGEDCDYDQSIQQVCSAKETRQTYLIPEDDYNTVVIQVVGSVEIEKIESLIAYQEQVPVKDHWLEDIVILSGLLFLMFIVLFGIHGWTRIKRCLTLAKNGLIQDRKKTLVNTILFLGTGGLTYLILRFYIPYLLGKQFNWMMNLLALIASGNVGCCFCFRKTLGKKPEVFFLILCISMGTTIVFTEPDVMISWDEPTHFTNAISFSYLGQTRLTEQDNRVIWISEIPDYNLSEQDEWHARQDDIYHNGVATRYDRHSDLKNYWLAFSGIGLFLGRVLNLSYYRIVAFGRLFSIIAYAVVGYFAIRRLKYGKMILASVLLIPSCVFVASNYSYDPGVIAFIALGLSYCFAEWQEPERIMQLKNVFVMMGSLFIGCVTKAIYFPVFILPLFMKKEKFVDKREKRIYFSIALTLDSALICTTSL